MTTRHIEVNDKAQVKALPNRAVDPITARELRGDQRDRRAVASGISSDPKVQTSIETQTTFVDLFKNDSLEKPRRTYVGPTPQL